MALRTPLTAQPHLYIGDSTGRPLDYGRVYFGEPNKDPEFYPIDIYLDPEMTIAAAQPVRTKGGFMDVGGNLAELHAAEVIYSLKVLDQYGRQVFYKPEMYRNNVSDFLVDEITRATAAETLIAGNLTAETQRAVAAEKVIATAVVTEKDRAVAAEVALDAKHAALSSTINSLGGGKKAYTTYALMVADKNNIAANSSIDVTNDTDPLKNGTYSYNGAVFAKSIYDVETIVRTKVLNTFKTKSLMDASALPDGADAQVTNDAVNNGLYVKTAGAWVLSKYDTKKTITDLTNPLIQDRDRLNNSKHYLEILDILGKDKLFTPLNSKFISHPSGEVLPASSIKTLAVSPLYALPDIRQDISIVGYGVNTIALYALYDKSMHLIVTSRGSNAGQQQFVILASEIPVNAAYIRYTYNSVSEHSLTGAEIVAPNNLKQEIVSEVIPATISSNLKDLEYSLQYLMTERTFISGDTGGADPTGSNHNLTSSPFIELLNPKLDIEVAGYGQSRIALYAFYNSDKEFISASTGEGTGFKKHIIPASDIPANAKYIRYTGNILNETYILGGVKLKSFSTYFQDIIDSSAGGENPIGTITITGASLAFDANDWFGIAVDRLGVTGINKARSSYGKPSTDGNEIWKDTFFTPEEFEDIDIFAFQYANVEGIADTQDLLPLPQDYTEGYEPTYSSNRIKQLTEAQAMDFILKTLQEKCYAQKDNPESKWYGSKHGKPLRLMFVTHWHDARVYYNDPIRVLAKRWGAAVCELDTKIGFSKDQPLPDGTQVSTLYAQDNELIDEVAYGHHPKRGYSSEYIQNRMGVIFAQSIKESFGY